MLISSQGSLSVAVFCWPLLLEVFTTYGPFLLERLTIVGLLLERLAICWPLAERWRVPILGGCAYLYENRRQDRAEQRERGRTREGWAGWPSWRWWTLAGRQAEKGVQAHHSLQAVARATVGVYRCQSVLRGMYGPRRDGPARRGGASRQAYRYGQELGGDVRACLRCS